MTQILEAASLLADFRTRRDKGLLDAEQVEQEARRAADLIIGYHRQMGDRGGGLRDAVTLLCEITADENREVARAGVRILFPALIERLNDSFDPAACELYDRIFAQMIDFYRRLRAARDFDDALRGFGLMSESDLLARKSAIGHNQWPQSATPGSQSTIRKVLLLSRVTIGADVAVTSVIIAKLRALLPRAEFVLLGSAKLRELFGGDPHARIREIKYERGGDLLSRLKSWTEVVEAVNGEINGLSADEFLLIDPDSRLTQLGLLPLLKNERNYLFFESRSYQGAKTADDDIPQSQSHNPRSIGWLSSCWVNEVFGATGETFPYVALPAEHRDFGRLAVEKLRRAGASRVTVVSLGVGGNQNKRVSEKFEIEMVSRLIKDSTLILDKGATVEEREQVNRVVAALRVAGRAVIEINESDRAGAISSEKIEADAITWDGGLGDFAGLIAASDQYIGYDSAGQHIAAALRVPTLTLFVNSNSPAFAERWRPYGPGVIEVLNVS
ncbi:MAG TPA: glycosyltransferase family 9 protein [Blastocatellia bacterium]|nr:glycosyltransferase family 9 protein [Blastocatellia bacterium]